MYFSAYQRWNWFPRLYSHTNNKSVQKSERFYWMVTKVYRHSEFNYTNKVDGHRNIKPLRPWGKPNQLVLTKFVSSSSFLAAIHNPSESKLLGLSKTAFKMTQYLYLWALLRNSTSFKLSLQSGHWGAWSKHRSKQPLQKVCPQGVVTGSKNSLKQSY